MNGKNNLTMMCEWVGARNHDARPLFAPANMMLTSKKRRAKHVRAVQAFLRRGYMRLPRADDNARRDETEAKGLFALVLRGRNDALIIKSRL